MAKNHITSFTKVVLFRNLALNCEQRNWFEQNLKPRHIYIFKHVYFDRESLVYTSQLSTSSHSFKYYQNEHHTQAIYIAFHGNKQSHIAHVKSFFSASILIVPSFYIIMSRNNSTAYIEIVTHECSRRHKIIFIFMMILLSRVVQDICCVLHHLGNSFVSLDPLQPLTEALVHERNLHEDIGSRWKELARNLGFKRVVVEAIQNENQQESERSFHLLVRWIEREGQEGATAGKLADALKKTELKNLAERLIGMCHKES